MYRLDQQFLLYLTAGFTDLNDSQSLVGYLQVSGPKFYRDLCPPEKRKEWLSSFASKQDYKVYTWLTKIKTTMPVSSDQVQRLNVSTVNAFSSSELAISYKKLGFCFRTKFQLCIMLNCLTD